tara:strand:+ start:373 stop:741 length:369 start_codon:yes stop_codon:yes gene_type:complete
MNIQVTKNAWNKMNHILKSSNNKYGFLYSLSSGGCNGFNFELDLLTKKYYDEIIQKKFLTILKNDNTKLYIDPIGEMYLLGTKIDYITEDYKKNIFENKFIFEVDKDLMSTCGCGTSFSFKK